MSPAAGGSAALTRLARSQESMWEVLCAFSPPDPSRTPYNVFEAATWDFPVDPDGFRAAVDEVMRRHHALRIVFTDTNVDPLIRVEPEVDTAITFADLTAEPAERRTTMQASILAYERGRTYDLRRGPLWRATLLRVNETQHLVAVTMSHVIADGWSAGVFHRDLRTAYLARAGQGPPLLALRLPYPAAMASLELDEAELRRRQKYWQERLTPLPVEWPYPPALDDPGVDVTAEASLGLPIPGEVAAKVRTFARRHRLTPFLLLLASYRILLGARTGWSRVVIATASTGREGLGTGADDLVGQFAQNSYLASTIDLHATLTEAIEAVRASIYGAMRHQASFYEIARAVNPDFDSMRPWPFFHLYHAWFHGGAHAVPRSQEQLSGRRSRNRPPPVTPDAQLVRLWAKRVAPGLTVQLDGRGAVMNYNPTMYPQSLMRDTLQGYVAVLSALLADPDQRISDVKFS
ncbi:MAG TPA: condensation domain-containing protein [Jiangellales bacterium]|nr:condensation domain-containing protein [Jiangellales bacterium]